VKRCVLHCFALGLFLCLQNLAKADQPPLSDFGGQIITGVDGSRVGIGTRTPAATLDVYQGEIKIGSTGAVCTKELAGTLRSTNAKLQFCDGASWRNVSLDKGQ
jgi:hypothetical protein